MMLVVMTPAMAMVVGAVDVTRQDVAMGYGYYGPNSLGSGHMGQGIAFIDTLEALMPPWNHHHHHSMEH